MAHSDVQDIRAFLAVAHERSFTRAAVGLGVSQPTLSRALYRLEERLGLPLLIRTTRKVSITAAGKRLLKAIVPPCDAANVEFPELSELSLTATDYAAQSILLPVAARLTAGCPQIRVEITADSGLTDTVAHRFDAGVRRGDYAATDMISVCISSDLRMAVAAAPAYFAARPIPLTPEDLATHNCINLKTPSYGGDFIWEFEKGRFGRKIRVDGQLMFNNSQLILEAGLAGMGLIYLTEDQIKPHVGTGRLIRVLVDWCGTFSGYHLYYPNYRQPTPAFQVLLDLLRRPGRLGRT